MNEYKQLPLVALDSVLVRRNKSAIEHNLDTLAPEVEVVGHRLEETGITLVLEGRVDQVYAVINLWEGDAR